MLDWFYIDMYLFSSSILLSNMKILHPLALEWGAIIETEIAFSCYRQLPLYINFLYDFARLHAILFASKDTQWTICMIYNPLCLGYTRPMSHLMGILSTEHGLDISWTLHGGLDYENILVFISPF